MTSATVSSDKLLPGTASMDIGAFAGVEETLAQLIRLPTVSHFEHALADTSGHADDGSSADAFRRFASELARAFPLAHERTLARDVGDRAVLLEWPGTDSGQPVILMSHYDVVPPGDGPWTRGPFAGDIADGQVWGRGAQDTKVTLAGALAAAEHLMARGFSPRRTVFFAFGGDEEVGGVRGAMTIAQYFAARGVRAQFLLDEGAPVTAGVVPFATRPVALVGLAEKGYADLRLEAPGSGGHASMPPRKTATGALARAVLTLERRRFPARLTYTTRAMLEALAPAAPWPVSTMFRHAGIAWPIVNRLLGANGTTDALIRTTMAVTMLSGSPRENVLPSMVSANVNVRLLPGDTVASALSRITRLVAPFGVTVRVAHGGHVTEASGESPADHEGFRAIAEATRTVFPGVVVAPYLFNAGTDSKHYRDVADAMYRFTPTLQTREEISRIHNTDERVSVENVRRCAAFYFHLIASL